MAVGGRLLEDIMDGLKQLDDAKKNPGYFSLAEISNVPYVEYPGFTKTENEEAQEQIKSVMRSSWLENNYGEVSITYRLDDKRRVMEKYKKHIGALTSVEFDETITDMAKKEGKLVVVILHNHPDNSGFSINDLSIFCSHESIRLMIVVNKDGQVSFLSRNKMINFGAIVSASLRYELRDEEKGFDERVIEWRTTHKEGDIFHIEDVIPEDKNRTNIIENILTTIISAGVVYSPYPGQPMPNGTIIEPPDIKQTVQPTPNALQNDPGYGPGVGCAEDGRNFMEYAGHSCYAIDDDERDV